MKKLIAATLLFPMYVFADETGQNELCLMLSAQIEESVAFSRYAESRAASVRSAAMSASLAGADSPMFRKAGDNIAVAITMEAQKLRDDSVERIAQMAKYCG